MNMYIISCAVEKGYLLWLVHFLGRIPRIWNSNSKKKTNSKLVSCHNSTQILPIPSLNDLIQQIFIIVNNVICHHYLKFLPRKAPKEFKIRFWLNYTCAYVIAWITIAVFKCCLSMKLVSVLWTKVLWQRCRKYWNWCCIKLIIVHSLKSINIT